MCILTIVLLNQILFFENIVDPDQLALNKAIRSGFSLFSTLIENMLTTGLLQVNKMGSAVAQW